MKIIKGFTGNIIARITVIILLALATAFAILRADSLFIPLILLLSLGGLTFNLINYIIRNTRDTTHLLLSLRQNIYSDQLPSNRDLPTPALAELVKDVTDEFGRIAMEKELHFQYLNAVNENISIGIISVDVSGKIIMANPAAKTIFHGVPLLRIDDLSKLQDDLPLILNSMQPRRNEVIRINSTEPKTLSVHVKDLVINEPIRIYIFQNIQSELDQKEVQAWQQLTRVLTHEIMNSVTPIATLSEALDKILKAHSSQDISSLSEDTLEDVASGVATIHSRSKSLLRFVKAYKEFAKTPQITITQFDVGLLLTRISFLFNATMNEKKIEFNVVIPSKPTYASGDETLLEQALINLIQNAIDALENVDTRRIIVTARHSSTQTQLSVQDSGDGVPDDIADNIFVPFFTTKSHGSGIGLSLCRQIMTLHKGNLKVASQRGKGATFTMEW